MIPSLGCLQISDHVLPNKILLYIRTTEKKVLNKGDSWKRSLFHCKYVNHGLGLTKVWSAHWDLSGRQGHQFTSTQKNSWEDNAKSLLVQSSKIVCIWAFHNVITHTRHSTYSSTVFNCTKFRFKTSLYLAYTNYFCNSTGKIKWPFVIVIR